MCVDFYPWQKCISSMQKHKDTLALQFVQQIDDVAFKLGQWDILGKPIYRAATAKYYRAKFKKSKGGLRIRIFLKSMYFINLSVFLILMIGVSIGQDNGRYSCPEVTVNLGNLIWEDAVMTNHEHETHMLVYSYFNGVYRQTKEFHDERPVYREMRKSDNDEYQTTTPAKIIYCNKQRAWVRFCFWFCLLPTYAFALQALILTHLVHMCRYLPIQI